MNWKMSGKSVSVSVGEVTLYRIDIVLLAYPPLMTLLHSCLRMMEGKMVELSQLLGLFTGKLMEQQDQVEEIYEAALGTNENVGQVSQRKGMERRLPLVVERCS